MSMKHSIAGSMRKNGKTYKEIAQSLGVSAITAKRYANESLNMQKVAGDYGMELSVRASNVLNRIGCKSKQDATSAITSKRLQPNKVRNYGYQTHVEVCRWCGLLND